MNINFSKQYLIPLLKTWKEAKEKEGFVPTVELLIEDLEARDISDHDCKGDKCTACAEEHGSI